MSAPLPFKGPIEGYVVNKLKKDFWRVQRVMEWEDVLQEAYLCYMRTCGNYPDVADAPHFMALFKRLWFTTFTDLANACSRSAHVLTAGQLYEDDEELPATEAVGSLDNDGALVLAIEQAPSEVLAVLNLFLNAPAELLEMAAANWRGAGRNKAEGSRAINRLIGLPPDYDSIGAVFRHFGVER